MVKLDSESDGFINKAIDGMTNGDGFLLQKHPHIPEFEGLRTAASNQYAQPLVYFRGASNGLDHTVPLYFGGGFSGAVVDINDGTQNDYTEFYTHPYSAGPTGCAGIQHANEIMGSYAILDTTAMMAMFPGTGYLDQHKGHAVSPLQNRDLLLSPDMSAGTSAVPVVAPPGGSASQYANAGAGGVKTVKQTQPSPIVLRFAHPFARYPDHIGDIRSWSIYPSFLFTRTWWWVSSSIT
jgi:hypothetical protein